MAKRNGGVVCERCTFAATPLARMRGLLGRRGLESDEGILLRPAASVHTAFMRFPIDVVFLDRDLNVMRVEADMPPWRTAAARRAKAVLELRAGEAARRGLAPGDSLEIAA
ncbi:MAG TPA: DUF192 domain-containing protein [Solirubrobacteraceae bacterium]